MDLLSAAGPFRDNSQSRGPQLYDFPELEFETAFRKVDSTHLGFITHDEIRIVLGHVYGDHPPEEEVEMFIREMTARKLARASFQEFLEIVTLVKDQRRQKLQAGFKQFKSHAELMEHRRRHVRAPYAPRDMFRDPMVTSNEYGWLQPAPFEVVEKKPKVYAPETKFVEHMLKTGVDTIF